MSLDVSTKIAKIFSRRHSQTSKSRFAPKRICFEPLEERQLLSLSPIDPQDVLVDVADPGTKQDFAADFDGDFVVTWVNAGDIYAKLIDRNGVVLHDTFRVNAQPNGALSAPSVAIDADGDFVVAWEGPAPEYGSGTDIYARRFNSIGVAQGVDFRVNSNITNPQFSPSVAMDLTGNFVVTWANQGQDLSFFNNVSAQRFDRFGNPIGAEFVVNSPDTEEHRQPDVAMGRDGRFIVAWDIGDNVYAKLYNPDASVIRDQWQIPRSNPDFPQNFNPSVDFDSAGNFFIAYTGRTVDVSNDNAGYVFPSNYARAYDAAGNQLDVVFGATTKDGEIQLDNQSTTPAVPNLRPAGFDGENVFYGTQTRPTISVDADGDVVVGQDGFGRDLTFNFPPLPGDPNAALISRLAASPLEGGQYKNFNVIPGTDTINSNLDHVNDISLIRLTPAPQVNNFVLTYSGSFTVTLSVSVLGNAPFPNAPATSVVETSEDITVDGMTLDNLQVEICNAIRGMKIAHYDPTMYTNNPIALCEEVQPGDPDYLANYVTYRIKYQDGWHDRWINVGAGGEVTGTYMPAPGVMNPPPTPMPFIVTFATAHGYNTNTGMTLQRQDVEGTYQWNNQVDLQPDGDFVAVWSEYQTGKILYRRFNESTDTAGPVVTDLLTEDSVPIDDGAFLSQSVQHMTVVFDEDMAASTVENPANWAINRVDGEFPHQISGGIANIEYGLNRSYELGLSPAPTNKWEAVITFDGNGPLPGVTPLEDGAYQLVGTKALRDKSLNVLNRTGFVPEGKAFTRDFRIQIPDGGETLANTTVAGSQFTESPQTMAGDANGDYTIVWTSGNDEVQLISIAGAPTGGSFQLGFNGNTTGDISFVPNGNGYLTALNIQNALAPYANVEVKPLLPGDGNGPFNVTDYQVTFVGDDGRTDQPQMTIQQDSLTGTGVSVGVTTTTDGFTPDGSGTGVFAQMFNKDRTPRGPEFQVNTTTAGDQEYPSIAMDGDGDFIVTWSSYSSDTLWDIYAQRYDSAGNPLGDEFLVNTETDSIQRYSTAAMDINGDTVITWQSYGQDYSGYGIYAQRYSREGYRVGGYDETQQISISGVPTGGTFKLNFDGNVTGDIALTLNDDGVGTAENIRTALAPFANVQVTPLPPFPPPNPVVPVTVTNYNVTFIKEDGSTDQVEMTVEADNITGAGTSVAIETILEGTTGEFQANQTTANNQTRPSVSAQANGQFVIAWESAGQFGDDLNATNIIARRFDSNDVFNQSTSAIQTPLQPAVSSLVSDTSQVAQPYSSGGGQDSLLYDYIDNADNFTLPGSKWDQPGGLGSTVTITYSYSNLLDGGIQGVTAPDLRAATEEALALWASYAPLKFVEVPDSGPLPPDDVEYPADDHPDIRIGEHMFDGPSGVLAHAYLPPPYSDGLAGDVHFDNEETWSTNPANGIDILEVMVHELGHALGLGHEVTNTAIMNPFYGGHYNGLGTAFLYQDDIDGIQALYGSVGTDFPGAKPLTPEFLVNNLALPTNQTRPDVALDLNGDYVITWTSYGQEDGLYGTPYGFTVQNGVFARRFDSEDNPVGSEFQVNVVTKNDQQNSRVAVAADGDFFIVWESLQDIASTNTSGEPDDFGIYARAYSPTNDNVGPNGEFGLPIRINQTIDGNQHLAGLTADLDGAVVYGWSGNGDQPGNVDDQGVFFRRFNAVERTAGPVVTDLIPLDNNTILVRFSEDLNTSGLLQPESVTNIDNWSISRNGLEIQDSIASVNFGLDEAYAEGLTTTPLYKYEAVVSLAASVQNNLDYDLTIQDFVEDTDGNRLDGDYDGQPGGDFVGTFNIAGPAEGPGAIGPVGAEIPVNTTTTGNQRDSSIAVGPNGDYVVVWTSITSGQSDIEAQLFDANANKLGSEFTVNEYTTGNQDLSQVVLADDGSFLVVWEGAGTEDNQGIYGRLFNADGTPQAGQFAINNTTLDQQRNASVAMDGNGDFVVVWSDYGYTDPGAVRARRFDSTGTPKGNDFLVTTNGLASPSVASDAAGDFVVTWSEFDAVTAYDVYALLYDSNGNTSGLPQPVNTYTADNQTGSKVAMDDNGNFVVVWNSFQQDGSGYGVYGQRFNAAGVKQGDEFIANSETFGDQSQADVHMDGTGNFTIVWTDQYGDDDGTGVFVRRYTSDGAPLGVAELVNTTTAGDQTQPAVGANNSGRAVVSWTGDDVDLMSHLTDIFAQRYNFGSAAGSIPRVTGVTIAGTSTTHSDYDVPTGSGNQLRSVPVGGANQITITFNVGVDVTENDLSVVGDLHGAYSFSNFNYNPATFTATWTVVDMPQPDTLTITLTDSITATIGDKALDGEWDNPTDLNDGSSSTFPSGNGVAGGNFVFNIRVLPGDANQDSKVDGIDYLAWAGHVGTVGGATFGEGDFNGDGNVDGLDYITWATNNGINQTGAVSAITQTGFEDFARLYLTFASNFGLNVTPGTSGDLTGDGYVDGLDYVAILGELGMPANVSTTTATLSSYSVAPATAQPVVSSAAVVDHLISDLDLTDSQDNDADQDDWFDLHSDSINELAVASVFDLDN